jgi:hypothetical protein
VEEAEAAKSGSKIHAQVQHLLDRSAILATLDRVGVMLDEHAIDDLRSLFTDDVVSHFGDDLVVGVRALRRRARKTSETLDGIHHIFSGVLIDLEGDHAAIRANLISTVVQRAPAPRPPVTHGMIYTGTAVRAPGAWRFSEMRLRPVWRSSSADLPVGGPPGHRP